MQISIILLNYKKPQLTLACLRSLYKEYLEELQQGIMEVIIVDNNSEDDSIETLQQEIDGNHFANTHLIINTENAGFGKGCNLGAQKAKGNYLLFLNNDTRVKDRGLLDMASYMDHHNEVAILGGQLRNPNGSLQASVGSFYTLSKVFLLLIGMQRFGLLDKSPTKIQQVDWVKGGLLMIRKEVFNKLGGFDENIFMYTEDMELCYRARKMGYDCYFYPDVYVLHAEHGSTNKSFAIVNIYKNLIYFYVKHRTRIEKMLLKLLLIVKAAILICIGFILRKAYLRKTYMHALREVVYL